MVQITDGTSNTLLLGEKHVRKNHLGEQGDGDAAYYSGAGYDTAQRVAGSGFPLARNLDDNNSNHQDMFGSWHPGVCMFAFAAGTVRGLNVSIDVTTLGRLANRSDGNTVSLPD